MTQPNESLPRRSRLSALLDHFAHVEDPRDVRRILHPLPEILLLVVCGTIADCDDYEDIAAWGAAHLDFLRQHLPYDHGVPGERWLTILMNRVNPTLFAAAFADWVRESWPERAGLVAIDGKTSRRSHDRSAGAGPLHLVSAFASTARLVLAQEAVPDKANELAAIPPLLARLGAEDGLKGALVSIDAIATNAAIATIAAIAEAIVEQGADYLLAVKANQPTLRADVEAAFAAARSLQTHLDLDKGHGRVEERRMSVLGEIDWLLGDRRFPGELRLPGAACLLLSAARGDLRRNSRPQPFGDPLLHLVPSARGRRSRRGRASPLGDREPLALGARRHLRRRPIPPPKGTRGKKHGHRPTLRPQPRADRRRPAIGQVTQKARSMVDRLPPKPPFTCIPLIWIRSPERPPAADRRHGVRHECGTLAVREPSPAARA